MQAPSRLKVPVWLLLVGIVGASAVIWALAPSSKRRRADAEAEGSEATQTAAAPSAAADLSRLRRAIEVLSAAHADPVGSSWASVRADPNGGAP